MSKEVTIGNSNVIDVLLETSQDLDEVVVTAMGIKKEKKSLGYAVEAVKSKSFWKVSRIICKCTARKVAGVSITNSEVLRELHSDYDSYGNSKWR